MSLDFYFQKTEIPVYKELPIGILAKEVFEKVDVKKKLIIENKLS